MYRNKLDCLPNKFTPTHSLLLAGKAGAHQSGALTGLHSNGEHQAFPTNIRLGWEWMEVTNTLTYCDGTTIMVVKSTGHSVKGVSEKSHQHPSLLRYSNAYGHNMFYMLKYL